MAQKDASVFVAELVTVGRKSGLPRKVELRFVFLDSNFYATTSSLERKHWCQNMLRNPAVEMLHGGRRIPCKAAVLTDEEQRERVLRIRDAEPLLDRTVFEIVPGDR